MWTVDPMVVFIAITLIFAIYSDHKAEQARCRARRRRGRGRRN